MVKFEHTFLSNREVKRKDIKWDLESLKLSMERFRLEEGNYPSTLDFDKVSYLPSSRYIQRNYGGIGKLKSLLGLEVTDLRKGENRSLKASKTYRAAQDYEEKFYHYLIQQYEEVSVHEHKILRPGNICCDFFVYTSSNRGYVIDIFFAQDMYSLARIINIKYKRYSNLDFKIYFILVGNVSITDEMIRSLQKNKKIIFSKNILIYTEHKFKSLIEQGEI